MRTFSKVFDIILVKIFASNVDPTKILDFSITSIFNRHTTVEIGYHLKIKSLISSTIYTLTFWILLYSLNLIISFPENFKQS